jgi:transketolase
MPHHEAKLKEIKKRIVQISTAAREGHVASAFSILDILWVLYDRVANIHPGNQNDDNRDRIIVSKGHSSLGIYSILAAKGFISEEDFSNFCQFDSCLGGHPDHNKIPGIEASTGSLGHGLPIAVGIAFGLKIKKSKAKTFTIIGDGESNEGTIWESALLAAHHNLSNLYCIVDYNHSTDRALLIGDVAEKFKSFGWNCLVINGHNHDEIYQALSQPNLTNQPIAIIAETTKGYGVKMMENNPVWHHKTPTPEELEIIMQELN